MILSKEILTQLRNEAAQQKEQHMAAANSAAGQMYLLDQQLAMLGQPEPKKYMAVKPDKK